MYLELRKRKNMKQLFAVLSLSILLAAASVAQEVNNKKVVDGKFVAVAGALIGSTILDVEGTFAVKRSLQSNPEFYFHERIPWMRPFVNSGKPATYAVLSSMNAGIIALSYRMKKSANPTMRRLWWLPPVMMAAGHAFAGTANFRLSRLR